MDLRSPNPLCERVEHVRRPRDSNRPFLRRMRLQRISRHGPRVCWVLEDLGGGAIQAAASRASAGDDEEDAIYAERNGRGCCSDASWRIGARRMARAGSIRQGWHGEVQKGLPGRKSALASGAILRDERSVDSWSESRGAPGFALWFAGRGGSSKLCSARSGWRRAGHLCLWRGTTHGPRQGSHRGSVRDLQELHRPSDCQHVAGAGALYAAP
mmetsp:Transcript_17801/g.31519  ORF Transcript_17801/g.31519 Transcript_17801/m.31519 type:complete len:213 (-) Transcript_17801:958-1596(-)